MMMMFRFFKEYAQGAPGVLGSVGQLICIVMAPPPLARSDGPVWPFILSANHIVCSLLIIYYVLLI